MRKDRKRGGNLEGCVVFLGGPELVGRLEDLARSRGIKIPLLYMKPDLAPSHLALNPMVGTTISFIDCHKVVQSLTSYRPAAVAEATCSLLANCRTPEVARVIAP